MGRKRRGWVHLCRYWSSRESIRGIDGAGERWRSSRCYISCLLLVVYWLRSCFSHRLGAAGLFSHTGSDVPAGFTYAICVGLWQILWPHFCTSWSACPGTCRLLWLKGSFGPFCFVFLVKRSRSCFSGWKLPFCPDMFPSLFQLLINNQIHQWVSEHQHSVFCYYGQIIWFKWGKNNLLSLLCIASWRTLLINQQPLFHQQPLNTFIKLISSFYNVWLFNTFSLILVTSKRLF